ncbi:MAG: alkene reductase, partial [Salinisphaeraceae bacterium]|nr:alkene reductase [Salinisphaeraceae bacterium]
MPDLFDPITIGDLELPNRIIMAPLTRCRASVGRVPNDLMLEYYVQRTSAGLIISEATSISPMAVGYPNTPGIWTDAQVAGWKKIVSAVHAAGGRMFLQLWHVGRISDPVYLDGELPLAPSAIAPQGHVSLLRPKKPYETPRALARDELPTVVVQYRQAAENAKAAGFDGVELHAANGYLLDQFLQTNSNQRSDEYGGPVENRARLLLDVVDAVIDVWGAGRVGVHLAPRGDAYDMGDADPVATFGYVAKALGQRGIAFIFTREHFKEPALTPALKQAFGGVVIANEQFDQAHAQQVLDEGQADAVAFGTAYIANPDLVERFRSQADLNSPNPKTFYGSGAEG